MPSLGSVIFMDGYMLNKYLCLSNFRLGLNILVLRICVYVLISMHKFLKHIQS